jgi:hypothetical protein
MEAERARDLASVRLSDGPFGGETCTHFVAGRMVQLNIDGSRCRPHRVMSKTDRGNGQDERENRRQNEIEKVRREPR